MITLSQKEENYAKYFVKALFYRGGVIPDVISSYYFDTNACKEICKQLINRQCDAIIKDKLDQHIKKLENCKFYTGSHTGWKTRPIETIIKYITWFCYNNNLIWGDIDQSTTTYELDAIKQTAIGKSLYENGCFQSNPVTAKAKQASTPKQPGQPPANGYKSTGGHSGDIPNLVGQPNQKVTLSGLVYCIEADKTGKNMPCAFITPVKVSSTGQIITVSKAQAEKVSFGSGNGYTDCCLWFDNMNDASVALHYCQNSFSKYTNFHVSKAKADPNGYFKVTCDCGTAYIKAKKLNEELEEKLQEGFEQESDYKNTSEGFKITDVDLYDEWMHKSVS